jgi:BirA family biotin operon repressor/biotin-[acetyl-CoA-carboxylase] ligase
LGRQWLSPRGAGIYCSTLLRPEFDQRFWPLITLMAAVAVHETLSETCGLQTDIKWPNDILHHDKKLCGILAEIAETPAGRAVIVGIGINLTDDSFPSELAAVATSVTAATDQAQDSDAILSKLQERLASWYVRLKQDDGAEAVVSVWSRLSSYASAKQIRIRDGETEFCGTTRGLTTDGALRVETDSGEMKIVRAGDVSLRSLS